MDIWFKGTESSQLNLLKILASARSCIPYNFDRTMELPILWPSSTRSLTNPELSRSHGLTWKRKDIMNVYSYRTRSNNWHRVRKNSEIFTEKMNMVACVSCAFRVYIMADLAGFTGHKCRPRRPCQNIGYLNARERQRHGHAAAAGETRPPSAPA